ncbi:MAG: multiheme c-type cytochrome [Desulfobacteria bacterium]
MRYPARRRSLILPVFFGVAILLAIASKDGGAKSDPKEAFVGSEKCASCHQIQYKGWVKTFHSTVVGDAKKDPSVILADMSDPDVPFRKEDVWFTIGGHWDQRYLTKIGDDFYILPRLWSVQSKKWRPYSTYGWQKRPYSKYCIGCHSVGFDPKTREVVEHSVGCESCHGAGAAHAAKPGKGNIVNPKRLIEDRAEDICASCHVRGKDLSGEYFFPIGWKPGDALSKFYTPLEKNEGESTHDAIHRLWDKWRSDRESQSRSRCEVCGIHQNVKPQGSQVSVDAICMSCHEYDEKKLLRHTRHKTPASAGCSDCHQQKDPDVNENKENNVHSYSYFLIHPQGCWDTNIQNRCAKCHADKPKKWAYDTVLSWKKPVIIDH